MCEKSALIAEFEDEENNTNGLKNFIDFDYILVVESLHEINFVGDKSLDFALLNHIKIE